MARISIMITGRTDEYKELEGLRKAFRSFLTTEQLTETTSPDTIILTRTLTDVDAQKVTKLQLEYIVEFDFSQDSSKGAPGRQSHQT